MGKIYSAPEKITKPVFDYRDMVASRKAEEDYIKAVSDWAKLNTKDKTNANYIGEVFSIPMADSQASYIVFSLKPVALIHLPIGDEWDSDMASQVSANYIKQHIDGKKRWNDYVKRQQEAKQK
jgi:hypothetical protein